jgi:hypothetical protein
VNTTDDVGSLVLAKAPAGLGVQAFVELSATHATRLTTIVTEELSRYPRSVRSSLPTLHVGDSALLRSVSIHAQYFPQQNAGVLTPELDLRGNVHRIVALSLINAHPEPAEQMRASWLTAFDGRGDADLYDNLFDDDSGMAAMIGAVVCNRDTLRAAASHIAPLREALELARNFLRAIGFTDGDLATLPVCPAYAYLSTVGGAFPAFAIEPGAISLQLRSPAPERFSGYDYKPVASSSQESIRNGVTRDAWILPESLLAETVAAIYIVKDVDRAGCKGIAGFASGPLGGKSELVVEEEGRRGIFYHELGHAIHHRFDAIFPASSWMRFVPTKGGYFGKAEDFINAGIWLPDYSPSLLDRGFITSYSSSSMAEDVAELCSALLSGDERLWAALADAPRVENKVQLFIDFMHEVDPVFTRGFFDRLAAERPALEAAWGQM